MLVARVRRTIESRGLIAPQMRVLCACSGGPDSAALLYCLSHLQADLGFALEAASVDHGLREDAAADVALAGEQAASMGVPFHPLRVQVATGGSVQAQARRARYAALGELAARLGAQRIAVGHTQDDQAETVLSRLLRGSGLSGLGAIKPQREDGVIRPLIDCRRADVLKIARAKFPRFAQDLSNHDPRFERVRIRSQLMPQLLAQDRALVPHLAQLADDARDCALVVEAFGETLFGEVAVDSRTLLVSPLRAQPRALRIAVLRRFVSRVTGLSPGRAELSQMDRTLCSDSGEVWLRAGFAVRASGEGQLRLCTRERQQGEDG